MQRLLALGFALVVAASVSAQVPSTSGFDEVFIQHEGNIGTNNILKVQGATFYLGDPAVRVPGNALPGATLRASRFTVRGWQEGDHVRVVVSAVVTDPLVPNRELETAIATYPVFWQRASVRVAEMVEWGAVPMILRAVKPLNR